jgi:flagellar hook-associated protein 1 FlgK
LAKSVIFEVNRIHCQGVGSSVFQAGDALTGTYQTATTLEDLTFGEEIDFSGSFKLWIGDANGENLQEVEIELSYVNGAIGPIDGTSSLAELVASINDQITTKAGLTGVTASVSEDSLRLTADATHTFAFSEDSSDILAALGLNTFFEGGGASSMAVNSVLESRSELIAAGRIDPTTGEYAAGDNSNALALVDLQYEGVTIKRWTYARGSAATSQDVSDTMESYLHYLVGSVGIESQSIQRSREFNELVVEQLQETRDNISAVSLDEEMINLMKYQHAYSAAAKLITTADEMLQTLLETK